MFFGFLVLGAGQDGGEEVAGRPPGAGGFQWGRTAGQEQAETSEQYQEQHDDNDEQDARPRACVLVA